jgi:hypothetical protein
MAWNVVYYRTESGTVPAADFLDSLPTKIEAKILAVVEAVAEAPPPSFSGGGMWEAMHGEMTGYFEIRVQGPGREHFRLFCLLDNDGPGLPGPAVVALDGRRKAHMTKFSPSEYSAIRNLGDDYKSCDPRRIAE